MTPFRRRPVIELPAEQTAQMRNAFRVALVMLGAAVFTALFYLMLAVQTGAWQLVVASGSIWLYAVVALAAAALARRGRADLGAGLLIGGMLVAIQFSSALLANLGVPLGLAVVLVTSVIAYETLPPGRVARAMVAALAAGVLASALDLRGPFEKLDLPIVTAAAPLIIGAALLLFAAIVVRQYRSYDMRGKLIIAFLGVSFVSAGAIVGFNEQTLRPALASDVGSLFHNLARSQALAISEFLDKQTQALAVAATMLEEQVQQANQSYVGAPAAVQAELERLDREWRSIDANDRTHPMAQKVLTGALAAQLRNLQSRFPNYERLILTDRYGATIAATERISDYVHATADWWQAAYADDRGAIHIGQPTHDALSGELVMTLAVPVYAPDSSVQPAGVLHAALRLESLTPLLASARFGQTGHSEIYMANGQEIEIEDGELELLPSKLDLGDLVSQLRSPGATPYQEIDHGGTISLASAASVTALDSRLAPVLSDLGWTVLVLQDRAESLGSVEAQARAVLLIALVLMGVMAASAAGLSRLLAAPIARLTAVARQVAGGRLDIEAPFTSDDEVGLLAKTFNSMTAQLRTLVSSLESQVESRTAQLRASAEVGRAAVSQLDADRLLRAVVNLITDRFGFYYAAVFTLDETGRFAVLREATGEAGRALKERGHQLEAGGRSMVGSAIARRKPRIALDVGQEAVRFANPLLPATRSEIALPLIVGDRVLGALDVQSTQAAAFDEASAAVLQTMADQIAVALNNAELFRRAERQARTQFELLAASLELTGLLEREALFETIARRIMELLQADGAGVWLPLSEDEIELVTSVNVGPTPLAGRRLAKGQGLSGKVFASERSLRVDDYLAWSGHSSAFEDAPFRAAIAVPMMWQGRLLGVLSATHSQPGRVFSPEDERTAQLYAAQAAAALAAAELRQQQQRTLDELNAINRRLSGEAWAQHFSRLPGAVQQANYARAGQNPVEEHRLPEVELAVTDQKAMAWTQGRDASISSPFQTAMAAPIVLRGEVIGALQVGESSQPRAWSADDLAFIQAVADQVALAVENARLLDQTQRAAQREKVIAEATDKIHRPIDLDAVLRAALEEVRRVTGSREVSIQLGVGSGDGNGQANGGGRGPDSLGGVRG